MLSIADTFIRYANDERLRLRLAILLVAGQSPLLSVEGRLLVRGCGDAAAITAASDELSLRSSDIHLLALIC